MGDVKKLNKYKVRLVSRDGHAFEFITKAKDQKIAIDAAFTRLTELNYGKYRYQLDTCEIIKSI